MKMPGATLSLYFSARFLKTVLGIFIGFALLIFLIELVETLKRASTKDEVGFDLVVLMAFLRTPTFAEQAIPFTVLIGTMASLLGLSRRNELVVARAIGLSVWQFLIPSVLVAFFVGVFTVAAYNPLATQLRDEHGRLEAEAFGASKSIVLRAGSSGVWLRQEGIDGQSVMRAERSRQRGTVLDDVTVQIFDKNGKFVERAEARGARFQTDHWQLNQVWVSPADGEPQFYERYIVSTFLTQSQIQESVADPDSISFWDLPAFIQHAEKAGLSTLAYRLRFQQLLSRPFVLVTMVVIAACVSIRLFRFGNIGRMIVVGLCAGFLFFFLSKVTNSLGEAGQLSPAAAVWLPLIIVMLAGLTILLYQEDG